MWTMKVVKNCECFSGISFLAPCAWGGETVEKYTYIYSTEKSEWGKERCRPDEERYLYALIVICLLPLGRSVLRRTSPIKVSAERSRRGVSHCKTAKVSVDLIAFLSALDWRNFCLKGHLQTIAWSTTNCSKFDFLTVAHIYTHVVCIIFSRVFYFRTWVSIMYWRKRKCYM